MDGLSVHPSCPPRLDDTWRQEGSMCTIPQLFVEGVQVAVSGERTVLRSIRPVETKLQEVFQD